MKTHLEDEIFSVHEGESISGRRRVVNESGEANPCKIPPEHQARVFSNASECVASEDADKSLDCYRALIPVALVEDPFPIGNTLRSRDPPATLSGLLPHFVVFTSAAMNPKARLDESNHVVTGVHDRKHRRVQTGGEEHRS